MSLVREATVAIAGAAAPLAGVPYGADLRLYTARGIPTVLYGPGGIEQAQAVDEYVPIVEVTVAGVLARVAVEFGKQRRIA